MLNTFNFYFWEFWAPYDPENGFYGNHKCIFDGANKKIRIAVSETEVSVKEDLYSNWKEWTQVGDNSKFLPAIRVTGGDPVGGGEFTGDVYFLINGWRLEIDHTCTIDGVLYSDDYPSPFTQTEGTQIVTNKVSALVNTVVAGDSGTSPEQIWSYPSRTLTSAPDYNGPTADQIASEVWNYSIRDLSSSMTPTDLWNFLLTTPMQPGSAGEKLKQVLTTGNFLALK